MRRALVEQLGLRLEEETLNRLLEKTNFSPMLLRLAVGQLRETNVDTAAFIENLETQPQVASYLVHVGLNDLTPAAQWLAKLITVFRQPLDLHDENLNELVETANPSCRLEDAVRQLQRRYLIDDPRQAALHPLISGHLYAVLSTDASLRKQLHRLAAQWSERAAGEPLEAAYHWLYAGEAEQAMEIISNQSESLFNRGQAAAAIPILDDTIKQMRRGRGNPTPFRRLLTARGDLLRGTFRAAEAEASYREALSLAQDQPAVRAETVYKLAQILLQRGQSAEALSLCQSAAAGLPPADTVLLARLASIEARAHLVLSNYEEAERVADRAIALAVRFAESLPLVADEVRARAERTLGWVSYTRNPQGTESLAHYRRALECARRAGLKMIECAVLSNIATARVERGELDQALETYREALQGYETLGDMYGKAAVLHNLAALYVNREDAETALPYLEQAGEIERRIGDREGLLSTDAARASLLLGSGKLAEARAILDAVLIESGDSTDP